MADQQPILQIPLTPEQILRWRRLLFRYQAIVAAKQWIRNRCPRRNTPLYIETSIFKQLVEHIEAEWFLEEPELEHVSTEGFPYLPSHLN